MAAWNFDRFQRSLQSGQVSPVYCLFGEETFLIEEAVQQLTEKALDGAPRDFNVDIFYGSDAEAATVRDAIEMLPMMAPRRVVILKEADKLSAKDLEELLAIVEAPIDTATVIVVADKVDQRKKFFKLIESNGSLVKVDRVPEAQLPSWIRSLAQRQGKAITEDAVMLIAQMVGASLLDINNEIQKLAQYSGTKQTIDIEDVKSVVSHSRLESVFGLTNALGERDRASSLIFLAQLLDHGESEVGILALISRHIRILLLVKEALRSGLSRAQISSRVGVPTFFIQQYMDQAQRWSDEDLLMVHGACLEVDKALKSSPVSSHIWLENFIVKATT